MAGIPDIVGCCQGRFCAFEVKLPGKEDTLSEIQKLVIKKIADAGGITGMVTTPEQAIRLLEDGLNPKRKRRLLKSDPQD